MALEPSPLPQWVKDCVERYKQISEGLLRWLLQTAAAIAIISNPANAKPILDQFSRTSVARKTRGARSIAVIRLKGANEYRRESHGGYHNLGTHGGMLRIPFSRLLQLVREVAASQVEVPLRVLDQVERVVRLREAVARYYSGSLDPGVVEKNRTHRKAIEVYSEILDTLRG